MLTRERIAALIPHQGTMCLLDTAEQWDPQEIRCTATSHLDVANPLRRGAALAAICGVEYGLQAAALHGALGDGVPQRPGFLAAIREVRLHVPRLDDPGLGRLDVVAAMKLRGGSGLIYAFALRCEQGSLLLEGQASIATPD
jgi:predicted hotdog family 3-hydroxylacyl-ACP dehydratase